MGDFNADLLSNSADSLYVRWLAECGNLFLVPYGPTHFTATSASWLDLCLVDSAESIISSRQEPVPFLSAHELIGIEYRARKWRPSRHKVMSARNWKGLRSSQFLDSVGSLDLSLIGAAGCIDEAVKMFNDTLLQLLNDHVQCVTFRARRPSAPWITPEIRQLIRERNRVYGRIRRAPSPPMELRIHFKRLRKLIKERIRYSRSDYCLSRVACITEPRRLWSELRSLRIVPDARAVGEFSLDPDTVNDFFCGVFGPGDPATCLTHINASAYSDERFYFTHVTVDCLTKHYRFPDSKVAGCDEFSGHFFRSCATAIFPAVLEIFNWSLSTSCFPETWKSALITPIPKKSNPSQPSDFRPISILPVLSRMLERIVRDDVVGFLSRVDYTDPTQYGFTAGGSTQAALIRVTDDIRRGIDARKLTVLVLFDFSKAFDTVDHSILLRKLVSLNFSESVVRWFWSYLTGRRQAVRISQAISRWKPVTSGVPQGSVLGPLLFNLYTADVVDAIHECVIVRYADDLQLYLSCDPDSLVDCITRINNDISRLCAWAAGNRLRLNPAKTKAMILGSARYINSLDLDAVPAVRVGDAAIQYVTSAKNLGIILTPSLNWRETVTTTCNRIYRTLYQLRTNDGCLTRALKKVLINTLVYPQLDYCAAVMADITEVENNRLQRALNACVRFVYGVRRSEHITPFFVRAEWLKVRERRDYFVGVLMFKALRFGTPSFLSDQLQFITSARRDVDRMTRVCELDVVIPACRTASYRNSSLVYGARLWNHLPQSIRGLGSVPSFKRALYSHLLRSQAGNV